jgi:sortase A
LRKRNSFYGSRAFLALLLSFTLALSAVAAASPADFEEQPGETDQNRMALREPAPRETAFGGSNLGEILLDRTALTAPDGASRPETAAVATDEPKPSEPETAARGGTPIETLTPEDVLSEEDRAEPPKYQDFFEPSDAAPQQAATSGGSAGALPAVKPFNFGRDPGGPADKTLYLTVPSLGLEDVPVFDSVDEEKLEEGVIHVPATGFPWQQDANTYIAGHRIGFPGTRSDHVFYDLEELAAGDEIILTDSAGGEYVYVVTGQQIVPPDNVEVMNAAEGRSVITLQTCTLPDFSERVVVQGELI